MARAAEFQSSGDEEGEGRSPAAGAPQVPDPTAPGAPALPTPSTSTAASLPPPPTVTALLEESTTATSTHRPSHEAHSHSHHGAVFEFACPICQTTSFKMSSMPTRWVTSLCAGGGGAGVQAQAGQVYTPASCIITSCVVRTPSCLWQSVVLRRGQTVQGWGRHELCAWCM